MQLKMMFYIIIGICLLFFSAQESVRNTILFLSGNEAVQLLTSIQSNPPLPGHELFNWIMIVNEDIGEKVTAILSDHGNATKCSTKAMFLLLPAVSSTKEYHRYFTNEVTEFANNSVHPLIAKFSEQSSVANIPSSSVADIFKAVWTLTTSLRQFEQATCSPFMSKMTCLEKLRSANWFASIVNETRQLDQKIFGSGISSLDGLSLAFDSDNVLKTNKYTLKVITGDCKLKDVGVYGQETGLLLDETIFGQLDTAPANSGLDANSFFATKLNQSSSELRATLVGSTTTYNTPSMNASDTDHYVTAASMHMESIRSLGVSGRPFIKPIDMDLDSDDQINVMSFDRNARTSDQRARSQPTKRLASLKDVKLPRNLVTQQNVMSGHVSHASSSKLGRVADQKDSKFQSMSSTVDMAGGGDKDMVMKRHSSLVSWLGRPWALSVLTLAIGGTLVTLYTFTFLLMKACEGALGRSNHGLASFHLFAVTTVFVGAVL